MCVHPRRSGSTSVPGSDMAHQEPRVTRCNVCPCFGNTREPNMHLDTIQSLSFFLGTLPKVYILLVYDGNNIYLFTSLVKIWRNQRESADLMFILLQSINSILFVQVLMHHWFHPGIADPKQHIICENDCVNLPADIVHVPPHVWNAFFWDTCWSCWMYDSSHKLYRLATSSHRH